MKLDLCSILFFLVILSACNRSENGIFLLPDTGQFVDEAIFTDEAMFEIRFTQFENQFAALVREQYQDSILKVIKEERHFGTVYAPGVAITRTDLERDLVYYRRRLHSYEKCSIFRKLKPCANYVERTNHRFVFIEERPRSGTIIGITPPFFCNDYQTAVFRWCAGNETTQELVNYETVVTWENEKWSFTSTEMPREYQEIFLSFGALTAFD